MVATPTYLGFLLAGAASISAMSSSSTGTHNGYYYSFWTDGASNPMDYENLDGGSFSVTWGSGGNFVGGKGWNPGRRDPITYTAEYKPNGNSYLAVYGWTRQPLIEYYVVENFHPEYDPSSAASPKGTVEVDGGTYRVLQTTRNQQPSIDGTATFQQFWSVRNQKRTSGTVTVAKHFDAWASYGMRLGTEMNYQIMAVEGYRSSGSAKVTVGATPETTKPPTTKPPTTKPPTTKPPKTTTKPPKKTTKPAKTTTKPPKTTKPAKTTTKPAKTTTKPAKTTTKPPKTTTKPPKTTTKPPEPTTTKPPAKPTGLDEAAKLSGRYMGTATDYLFSSGEGNDQYYMAELKNTKDWSMITPANMYKPEGLQPNKGSFSYQRADQFASFVKGMGAKLRCHTLLWHNQSPGWMQNAGNNASMLQALTDHITGVMTHFGDDCYAWDVVNEVVDDNGGYRNSFWYQKCGASYIAHAFNVANQVKQKLGLKVKLYYNDYSIEWEGSAKTKFAQSMVKGLLDQGVKVDGVGMQAHFEVGGTPSKSSLMGVMKYYTDLGLDVAITELDIRTDQNPSSDKKAQQVKDYKAVIGACKATKKCVGATVWDFDDANSWVPSTFQGKGYALPFMHTGGQGTPLVKKDCYQGIMDGWTE